MPATNRRSRSTCSAPGYSNWRRMPLRSRAFTPSAPRCVRAPALGSLGPVAIRSWILAPRAASAASRRGSTDTPASRRVAADVESRDQIAASTSRGRPASCNPRQAVWRDYRSSSRNAPGVSTGGTREARPVRSPSPDTSPLALIHRGGVKATLREHASGHLKHLALADHTGHLLATPQRRNRAARRLG